MGSTPPRMGRKTPEDFVSWFEIPVFDIYRAAAFYKAIFQVEMSTSVNGDFAMAFFPASQGVGGALVAGPGCAPNATGVLIYLNAGHELDAVLGRVDAAGGRVIMPRTTISESAGAFALFIDSEGNRLALHEAVRAASPTPPRTVHPVTVAGKVREAARRAGRKKPAARKTRKKRGTKRR